MPFSRSDTLEESKAQHDEPPQRTLSAPAIVSRYSYPDLSAPSARHYWDYEYKTFRSRSVSLTRTTTIVIDYPHVLISVRSPTFLQRINELDFLPLSKRFWNSPAQNFLPPAQSLPDTPEDIGPTSCFRRSGSTHESAGGIGHKRKLSETSRLWQGSKYGVARYEKYPFTTKQRIKRSCRRFG